MGKVVKLLLIFLVGGIANCYANNILNIPLHTAALSLNPTGVQDRSALWVSRQINCQLVRTQGGELSLEAAKSIKYISPLKVKIVLNSNIKFHDGTQLTAEDVVASFEYLKKSRHVLLNVFSWVKTIDASGDSEVIFTLSKPIPQFLKVLSSPNYAIFKKEFINEAMKNPSLWKHPAGCGNYLIEENTPNYVLLKPMSKDNPKIKFYLLEKNQLKKNELDKYDIIDLDIPDKSTIPLNFHKVYIFDPRQLYLGLNTKIKPWNNKENRCALLSSINKDIILKNYAQGANEANDFVPQGVLGYKNTTRTNKRAYTNLPKTNSVCLAFLTVSIPETRRNVIRNAIRKIYPVQKTINIKDTQHFSSTFQKQKCDILAFDLKSNYLDAYEFLLLFSESDANFSGLKAPKLVEEIKASQELTSSNERYKKYRTIIEKVNELCVVLPLLTIPNETVYIKNNINTPNIGKAPINDYYLGNVSWKKD